MSGKIKMIGLDLDGTLLTDKKELTERSKEVIAKALRQGIIVLVATGRPWTGVPEELRNFPGMRYALTSNGARVVDTYTGRVIEEHLLSPELAKKSLEICGKYDTLQEVYFDGQGYAEADKMAHVEKYHKNPNMWEYMKATRIPENDLAGLVERKNRGLDKTQALFADMEERGRAWAELEEIKGLELVGSLKYNIEINAAGVNKGTGLISLGKILGIKREEIMACGDGDNDAVMLREVGLGVAMANAEEQVKAAADYITLSNEEDGVAGAIEKFALEGGKGVC
ncbi:Cof-type HAD-IIB family hydrolase [Ruminococcus sp. CLA-AA-H200]|uniref:Cof-type HAD-IIB family hydrolase n=1 Tax=Ruminococcus turbiniformis TaxID=2881258 RepID=A0ABS8G218_9FIRM|nr:Cof-type HAD-IIB family hydrolase [Ruminococcus turbiniformis]MCC2255457.1 Cof-type HAD-IIB family hydrolase [Ruminococcus turbiniformis]